MGITIARVIATVFGGALLGAIIWAAMQSSLLSDGGAILALPWGWVTMIDLYVGFVLFACVIALLETKRWVALAWIAPIFFLGNIVTAAWLVIRAPGLIARRVRS